jgi:predicted phage terminase large subunit-like protein
MDDLEKRVRLELDLVSSGLLGDVAAVIADKASQPQTPADFAILASRGRWKMYPHLALLNQKLTALAEGRIRRLIVALPVRHGKLLTNDTVVLSGRGWITHGELVIGDTVFAPDGRQVLVEAISEEAEANVRIEFSNGEVVFCHENHEWRLFDRARREWMLVETNYFLRNMQYGRPRKIRSGQRNLFQLPITSPVEFPVADLLLHPYVLGAWLGDGSKNKPNITGGEPKQAIVSEFEKLGFPVSNAWQQPGSAVTSFAGGGGRFTNLLKAIGVFDDKNIPEIYLRSSVAQRLELLAGLIDTDGHVSKKDSRVRIVTTNEKIRDGVMDLCTTLGLRPYLMSVPPTTSSSGIVGKLTVYTIGFQPTIDIPTRVAHKKIMRIAKPEKIGIVKVERVESGEMGHCIQVEGGEYLVGRTLIPTHNSELCSKYFPAWYLGRYPDNRVIFCSYQSQFASKFGKKARNLIAAFGPKLFGVSVDEAAAARESWEIAGRDGGMECAGTDSGITGKGANCLCAGTRILTDRGLINIEDAADSVGHRIMSFNHETGAEEFRFISAFSMSVSTSIVTISTVSGRKLRCTDDHRISTREGYIEARLLGDGQAITSIDGDDFVASISMTANMVHVYDIQVEGNENFYANGILVHNCLIIDDPLRGTKDANSKTRRNAVWDFWEQDASTRLEPNGSVLIVASRWHLDDLTGRLLAQDANEEDADEPSDEKWETLILPALAEKDDPLGRKEGEALWPDRYPRKRLLAIKARKSASTWNSLYQQRPTAPGGSIFKRENFRFYDVLGINGGVSYYKLYNAQGNSWNVNASDCRVFLVVDSASSEKKEADYTVIGVWVLTPSYDMLLVDMWREQARAPKVRENIIRLYREWKCEFGAIEKNTVGLPLLQALRDSGLTIMPVEARVDKVTRADGAELRFASGQIHFPKNCMFRKELAALIEELESFPKGARDDCVDMTTWSAFVVNRIGGGGSLRDKDESEHKEKVEAEETALAIRENVPGGKVDPKSVNVVVSDDDIEWLES